MPRNIRNIRKFRGILAFAPRSRYTNNVHLFWKIYMHFPETLIAHNCVSKETNHHV